MDIPCTLIFILGLVVFRAITKTLKMEGINKFYRILLGNVVEFC